MKKCKVIDCKNMAMDKISKNVCDETMKDACGYCQIHRIEGLVKDNDN